MYNISAMIVAYNEEEWIHTSVMSILPYVDDIVFVDDQSTDDTVNIIKSINNDKIRIFTYNDHNITGLGNLKNFCKEQTKYDIVIRWDADFIAYPHITELFDSVVHTSHIYNSWILSGPNVEGDIYHQPINHLEYGPEAYIFNKHNVSFSRYNGFDDFPVSINAHHNYSFNNKAYWIHMNTLKHINKLMYRLYMSKYLSLRTSCDIDYFEWVGKYIYNGLSPDDTKYILYKKYTIQPLHIKSFDFKKYGEHPEILLQSQSCNIFKLKKINGNMFRYYEDL